MIEASTFLDNSITETNSPDLFQTLGQRFHHGFLAAWRLRPKPAESLAHLISAKASDDGTRRASAQAAKDWTSRLRNCIRIQKDAGPKRSAVFALVRLETALAPRRPKIIAAVRE